MNEDYLWDKTGNDSEIENLENLLSQFRYKETSAPAIVPEKVLTIKKAPRQKFFNISLAFSFASCAAFVLILFGIWFQISNKNIENITDLSKPITPQIKIVLPEKSVESFSRIEKAQTSQQTEKPAFTKVKNISKEKSFTPQKTVFIEPKNKVPITETVKLTAEEQYAYDQLMLALSITSSKLKMVRDKVALDETPEILIRKEIYKGRN